MLAKKATTPRRAATRERLVQAAMAVVARRGFHAATVDEIAAEAGYSVGAIYSNFKGKDELFLSVFDHHMRWFAERLEAAEAGPGEHVVRDWMSALGENPEQLLIFVEFWAYAVRTPRLRRRFAARLAEVRDSTAAALERRAARSGRELQLPAATLALVLMAIGRGLGLEKLADPDAVDDSVTGLLSNLVP